MNALRRLFTPAQPRMPLGGLVLSTAAVVVAVLGILYRTLVGDRIWGR